MDLRQYSNANFDRGAPIWKEALWVLVKGFFFQTWFPWPSSIRCAWLRLFGAAVGRQVVIRSRTNITFPWRVRIGDDVWIGEEVCILSLAEVELQSSVCLSQRAFLCTGSHDFRRTDFALVTKAISIRQGAWIAAQAFVGPGVTVGADAVVSAGSIVLRDIPPGAVVRGNPAEPLPEKS